MRKVSGIVPRRRGGERSGSKGGHSERIVSHQDSGTGGSFHKAGSGAFIEYAGIMRVPLSPMTSSRASTTASAPPTTHPKALSEECTSTVDPVARPRFRRSEHRLDRVAGAPGVLATVAASPR